MPEAKEKIARGEVALTALAQAQTAINFEERRTKKRVSSEVKRELVAKLAGERPAEAIVQTFPEYRPRKPDEFIANADGYTLTTHHERKDKLERAKELMSHALPHASWSDVIERLADDYLKKHDPLLRHENRIATQGDLAARRAERDAVVAHAGAACEFVDSRGERCGSRYQVQVDHVWPRACGGADARENYRALCGKHNRHMGSFVL